MKTNWLDRQLAMAQKKVAAWPQWKQAYLKDQIKISPYKQYRRYPVTSNGTII